MAKRSRKRKLTPGEAACLQLLINNTPVIEVPKELVDSDGGIWVAAGRGKGPLEVQQAKSKGFLATLQELVGRPLRAPKGLGPDAVANMVELRTRMEDMVSRVPALINRRAANKGSRSAERRIADGELWKAIEGLHEQCGSRGELAKLLVARGHVPHRRRLDRICDQHKVLMERRRKAPK